jgi:hypothetical protein
MEHIRVISPHSQRHTPATKARKSADKPDERSSDIKALQDMLNACPKFSWPEPKLNLQGEIQSEFVVARAFQLSSQVGCMFLKVEHGARRGGKVLGIR